MLPTKELNRAVLGRIIFENKELRGKLNQITHPTIHRTIFWRVFKYFMSGHAYIVLDLPLLFETGILMDFIHKIITVSWWVLDHIKYMLHIHIYVHTNCYFSSDPDKQMQRLLARNELSEPEARNRVESQMPLDSKCEKSHFVIDNNGSIEETEAAAMRIYNLMQESNKHWYNRFFILGAILIVCFAIYFLNKIFDFWPTSRSL